MPLGCNPDRDFLDRMVGGKAVHRAAYYDAGVYTYGRVVVDVAHAPGVVRAELQFITLMGRAMLRSDEAVAVNATIHLQFWVNVQHPF